MIRFLFLFLVIILAFCKPKETVIEEKEVVYSCNEIDTLIEKEFIDIDSIHRVFIPIIEDAEFIVSIQKDNPISLSSSHSGMSLGFCNEEGTFDPPLCYDFSLFRYEDFIEKEFPDSVITRNKNLSIVLDNVTKYCKNEETIGVLYWGYIEHLEQYIGRFYFSDFKSTEYFYLLGRLVTFDEKQIPRLNTIMGQIEIQRL